MTFTDADTLSYCSVGKSLLAKANNLYPYLMVGFWAMRSCVRLFHARSIEQSTFDLYIYLPV